MRMLGLEQMGDCGIKSFRCHGVNYYFNIVEASHQQHA